MSINQDGNLIVNNTVSFLFFFFFFFAFRTKNNGQLNEAKFHSADFDGQHESLLSIFSAIVSSVLK